MSAVRAAMERFPNVHLSLCPHDGPTSKADCLNWIYQQMLLQEELSGERFDAIVIGAGSMGSATAYNLAKRGQRVLALDQFNIGHDRGSGHGVNRIIRLAYAEHPTYVPLLRRTYDLWRALEAETGQRLMRTTGIVEIGPPEGDVVAGTLAASRLHSLPHELLDAAETMRRETHVVKGSKGSEYVVTRDGRSWSCTCVGFGFHKSCKHINSVQRPASVV